MKQSVFLPQALPLNLATVWFEPRRVAETSWEWHLFCAFSIRLLHIWINQHSQIWLGLLKDFMSAFNQYWETVIHYNRAKSLRTVKFPQHFPPIVPSSIHFCLYVCKRGHSDKAFPFLSYWINVQSFMCDNKWITCQHFLHPPQPGGWERAGVRNLWRKSINVEQIWQITNAQWHVLILGLPLFFWNISSDVETGSFLLIDWLFFSGVLYQKMVFMCVRERANTQGCIFSFCLCN